MGEVGAVHSQCVILGDFILGTLDRIREDLVVDGLLHGTYRELGVDVGRRQVIEHLITLFYRNRVMKNLEEQGVVVKEESGDKGKGRKRRSNVSSDRDLLAKSRRVDPVSKYSKNSSQASVTKLPPITTICTQSKNTQNASGIKDLQSDFPESADVEEEEENKDGGKSSQEEEDDEETDENDIFDDDGNDEEIEEGNRKTAPDIFDSSPRIPTKYSCGKCERTFSSEKAKNEHLQSSSHMENIVCPTCGKTYASKASLRKHSFLHNKSTGKICTICQKNFPTQILLESHVNTHTKQKTFECAKCKKAFPQYSGLIRHTGKCVKQQIFQCDVCKALFSSKDVLNDHSKAKHKGELRYECHKCGKFFPYRSTKARHLAKCSVQGEKP